MRISQIVSIDANRRDRGVWRQFFDTGLEVCIASIRKPSFLARRSELLRGVRTGQTVDESTEENLRTIAPAIAEEIILDWRGATDNCGEPIPYSQDEALAALQSDEFYRWVIAEASGYAAFTARGEGDARGN